MDTQSKIIFLQEVLNRKRDLFSKDSRVKDEVWQEVYEACCANGCQGLRDADYLRRTTYQNLQRRAKEKYEKGLKVGLSNVNLTEVNRASEQIISIRKYVALLKVDQLLLTIIGRDRNSWSTTTAEDAISDISSALPHDLQSLFSLITSSAATTTTTKFDDDFIAKRENDDALLPPGDAESTSASVEWDANIDESAAATPTSAHATPPPPPHRVAAAAASSSSSSPQSPTIAAAAAAAAATAAAIQDAECAQPSSGANKFGSSVVAALIEHQRTPSATTTNAAALANGGGTRANGCKRSFECREPQNTSAANILGGGSGDIDEEDERALQRQKLRAEIALIEAKTLTQQREARLKQLQVMVLERELNISSVI